MNPQWPAFLATRHFCVTEKVLPSIASQCELLSRNAYFHTVATVLCALQNTVLCALQNMFWQHDRNPFSKHHTDVWSFVLSRGFIAILFDFCAEVQEDKKTQDERCHIEQHVFQLLTAKSTVVIMGQNESMIKTNCQVQKTTTTLK